MPRFLRFIPGAALALCMAGAHSQGYPSKPLRIIVPFAPGGSTDIVARVLADKLSVSLAQPVVVENRAGAAGNIGAEAVAKSTPDGYTLLMATTGVMAINNALYKNMAYDAAKDLEPVSFTTSITNVLAVPMELPAKNVAELVALAKAGRLSFASSGAGSSTHLSAELFRSMAGIDLLHIPYKGSGQALTDLMAGRVSMIFDNMPSALPYIRGGKLRALAVTASKRSAAMPELPTIAESGASLGLAGYESLSWSGIAVPAGTPKDAIQRLNRDISFVLAMIDVKHKLGEQGADPVGGPPEVFADHIRAEREKWGRLIRERGITVN